MDQLLSQIGSQEILEIQVPKGTLKPLRSAKTILEQTQQIIITQVVHSQKNLPEIGAELGGIHV